MEVLLALLVLAGLAWWFVFHNRKDSKSDNTVSEDNNNDTPVEDVPAESPKVDQFSVSELDKLTKVEIEKLGKNHGVELNRRKNKMGMIDELRSSMKK
jgi:hypothetical protein